MTAQAPEAPPAPAEAAPLPSAPAPTPPVPAPPPAAQAPAPQPPAPAAPREPDGRYAPAPQPPAPAEPAADASADLRAQLDQLRAEADQARAEAQRWKAQSRTQETRSKKNYEDLRNRDAALQRIAEHLGIDITEQPDPEELTRHLAEARQTTRQLTVERAVYLNAAKAGADAAALLDSREFINRTAAIDPDAPDFESQVAELVQGAANEARYKLARDLTPQVQQAPQQLQPADQYQQPPQAQPPAQQSGADFSGAPRQDFYWTEAQYSDYIARAPRDDPRQEILMAAIAEGRLEQIGIGRPKARGRR